MSEQKTYTPLSSKPENDFPLVATTRGTEKKLHELQVRSATNTIEERKWVCRMENWKPEEKIPELSEDTKVGIDALKGLIDRSDNAEAVEKNLQELVDSFDKGIKPVENIPSGQYWLSLANLLLEGFEETFPDANPDDLNFKEISAAYNDFF